MTVKVASYVSRCKRSRNPKRTPIVRSVPPIVSEVVWEQAQATLQHNLRFGLRHCRRLYLLRGLVKCGRCRLTYIGMTVRGRSGRQESYYRCNGKHDTRGVYGAMGQRCPSKDVHSGWLEQAVWEEIEEMLAAYVAQRTGKPAGQIDRERRFDRLGLDSADAVALVGELEDFVDRPRQSYIGGVVHR